MRYPRTLRSAVVSAFVLVLGACEPFDSSVWAAEDGQSGRQLYLRYCSACHGPEAKGDGVAGTLMRPQPADLTLLASKNGGEFPMERVVRNIDGREALRAHGEPGMPVWGEVLGAEYGSEGKQRPPIERRVQGRILSIVDYLRSIQAK
jgi:mono/diheme cytochrome c family protein